ncbi:hypothetical protein G7048_12850 [Diaphorobacter sp. HDW4B]|uniref:spermine/spermidine synthase domain-containing protein n=1 Tax=Diaphorobacter sp. HDW4B TaxID=2714925 RepID=UPI0014094FBC|nr:hypothetical protein [Diaphorobacter sp. HDW4B]QIL71172.1 hypothetical protein G7048_12850 [Diaphorobacter sp. HDW4B]
MNAIRFVSFWTGYCSLSFEIAWIRLYGYANLSTPKAFSYVLVVFLMGIAFGALLGKYICRQYSDEKILKTSIYILLFAAIFASLGPWIAYYARAVVLDNILTPAVIFVTSGILATLFPVTHHLGTPKDVAISGRGKHFSNVYILNVAGAALGPLVTGYILLEYFTITQIFPLISLLIILLAMIVWRISGVPWKGEWRLGGALILNAGGILLLGAYSLYDPHSLVRLFANTPGAHIVSSHEGRHGVITLATAEDGGTQDAVGRDFSVYGGNVYDGKTNVDLEKNTNGLERLLALHVLQPEAKKVLIVGLSIGSWLTVLEGFHGIDEIDVVEINSGYLELANKFAPQRRAIHDPRVKIHIDDARRWLKFHPEKKYDIILMNTTWHWRSNSSMLLSKEMLSLIEQHLTDRGVMAFNATGSVDAFYTASQVFRESRRYVNFIYGANWNAFDRIDLTSWDKLWGVSVDGHAGFSKGSLAVSKYASIPFVKIDEDLKKLDRLPEIITDDNMLVEYKYGLSH